MREFHLVINQEKLHVFQHENGRFEPEFFDSKPYLAYEASRVGEAVDNLTDALVDNYEIEYSKLSFIAILSDDKLLNQSFEKALEGKISRKISIDILLPKAIGELARNPALHIEDLGVNYDGKCYRLQGKALTSSEFSLVAFTLKPEDMLAALALI